MSQTSVSTNPVSAEISGYLNQYMERRNLNGASSNPNDIYQELEDKERDLALAAELGRALLDANENLRHENEELIEKFQQKIYEMENEKASLKKRLESAENDYEMQLQALQQDVASLRKQLCGQRSNHSAEMDQRAEEMRRLAEKNAELGSALEGARGQNRGLQNELGNMERLLGEERAAMQKHVLQLDVLHAEILLLRADKRRLESQITEVTAERDLLVLQLEDASSERERMERQARQNRETIEQQQQEIQTLQQTADFIQDSLNCLQGNKTNGPLNLHSEMAVSEPKTQKPGQLWWRLWLETDETGEDGAEMDDESVLASMADTASTIGANGAAALAWDPSAEAGLNEDIDYDEPEFVRQLRCEVVEVYAQLRAICADLSFRHRSHGNNGGGDTPAELAVLEMDFRLAGLQAALAELRGLLADLGDRGLIAGEPGNAAMATGDEVAARDAVVAKSRELETLQTELYQYEEKLRHLEREGRDSERVHDELSDVQRLGRAEANPDLERERAHLRRSIMDKKINVAKRLSRTQSEMEMIYGTPADLSSWGKWPISSGLEEDMDDCEYD